jgi:hypothetical protein
MAANIPGGIGSIGSGIGDLFSASGDQAEANAYGEAATIATQNAELEVQSTKIQEAQSNRQVYQTLGAQESGVAAGGFAETGSAKALFQNSAQQGALQKQVLEVQGTINENAYTAAADAYKGQQQAAIAASEAAQASGVGGILGGIASIFGI